MKVETAKSIKLGVWSAIGGAVIAMIIGFSVGGWVLGSTSIEAGEEMAEKAVVERLVPICVGQFNLDEDKDIKLKELSDKDSWNRAEYVREQGWATMPFEENPDRNVAARCSDLIMKIDQ